VGFTKPLARDNLLQTTVSRTWGITFWTAPTENRKAIEFRVQEDRTLTKLTVVPLLLVAHGIPQFSVKQLPVDFSTADFRTINFP